MAAASRIQSTSILTMIETAALVDLSVGNVCRITLTAWPKLFEWPRAGKTKIGRRFSRNFSNRMIIRRRGENEYTAPP